MEQSVGGDEWRDGDSKEALRQQVVSFLLQEDYVLTAFELLHEFLEDGQLLAATRLQDYFSKQDKFPADQMLQLQSLQALETQRLSDEKEVALEKVAASEYELRLAREDIQRLQERLDEQLATPSQAANLVSEKTKVEGHMDGEDLQEGGERNHVDIRKQMSSKISAIGEVERRDLNCAVKEYLVSAGYKLTAMCLRDEVGDQDLDKWEPGPSYVEKALRTYYQHFLNSKADHEHIQHLEDVKQQLLNRTEAVEVQRDALIAENQGLTKALAESQQALNDRDKMMLELQERFGLAERSLQSTYQEVVALKEELKKQQQQTEEASAQIKAYQNEKAAALSQIAELQTAIQNNPARKDSDVSTVKPKHGHAVGVYSDHSQGDGQGDADLSDTESRKVDAISGQETLTDSGSLPVNGVDKHIIDTMESSEQPLTDSIGDLNIGLSSEEGRTGAIEELANGSSQEVSDQVNLDTEVRQEDGVAGGGGPAQSGENEAAVARTDSDQIRQQSMENDGAAVLIIAESLPKIVPNVLINHREELLPLFMCAIERHPDVYTRDALTNGLFNLIKKPDEEQRRVIMDACVALAAKIGEDKTESELLPQCWEQINHKFAERRLLVAQSCGRLAQYVRPSIRSSLILSILSQLTEDNSPIVREGVAHNLALLLPYLEDLEKYSKVEELVFHLVCDPAGEVVKESLETLVPALLAWSKAKRHPLSHFLRAILNRVLANVQQAAPASGVEGSPEANLRILGERQRWSIDVLLRVLIERLPDIRHAAVKTCPAAVKEEGGENGIGTDSSEEGAAFFSEELLQRYASSGGELHWPALDWLAADCIPTLLKVACMLPPREEALRLRLSRLLLAISQDFGQSYAASTLLPLVLAAAGYPLDTTGIPSHLGAKAEELQPAGIVGERLARMCVLPLLLVGVLGARGMRERMLGEYLRELVLSTCLRAGPWNDRDTPDLIDAVRFLCTQTEHHDAVLGVLWELVVNPTPSVRITAAVLFRAMAGYVDEKRMSQQVLPALVTLGSDPNVEVKYSSIAALGAVALHFKDETIVEKVRIQMDSYLDDGSQEATVAVIRTLTAAVPVTVPILRDYLLQKLAALSSAPLGGSMSPTRRKEWKETICGAIRALDATDMSTSSVQTYFLPVVQLLLKEPELLQPSSKEALEVILRERGGLLVLGKAMSKSLFGDGGLFVKRDTASGDGAADSKGSSQGQVAESEFARIMRTKYNEMLRGKTPGNKQLSNS